MALLIILFCLGIVIFGHGEAALKLGIATVIVALIGLTGPVGIIAAIIIYGLLKDD